MNHTDSSIVWLLSNGNKTVRRRGVLSGLGALGTNGKTASGSSGSGWSSADRRGFASDITRSVAEMTTGITRAVLESRRPAAAAAAPTALAPDTIGGEAYGVQARTPWGTIALGGTAVVVIGGLLLYISATKKSKEPARRAA